ncbi:MAG: thiamine-phosphate kinase [Candidatus Eisenbacteria bacterium]
MTRLGDLGEFELIRRLLAAGGPNASASDAALNAGGRGSAGRPARPDATDPAASIRVGPGDDAAVVLPEPGRDLVVTTDAFILGRHWLDGWIEPHALGARLARANLSDLAAMAARPRWATVSMGLAASREVAWVEAIQAGLAAALAADGASLIGGNIIAVEHEDWLGLTLIGDARPGLVWTRSGARPGDFLAVTGHPGRAGAAVALIRALGEPARATDWQPLLEAWAAPVSRVDLARALAASGAVTAAIDTSDGVGGDLSHLCDASGVGAVVEARGWQADPALAAAARRLGRDVRDLRLGASDDYELLMAVDPERAAHAEAVAREARVPWSLVGRITAAPSVLEWVEADGRRTLIEHTGYDHFG